MDKLITTPSGSVANVPVTDAAEHVQELAKADYIVLDWNAQAGSSMYEGDASGETRTILQAGAVLPVGSYITDNGINYLLADPYVPTQVSENCWRYTPKFEHPFYLLRKSPYFFVNEVAPEQEGGNPTYTILEQPTWSLTAGAAKHIALLNAAIQAALGTTLSAPVVDNNLYPASAALEFNNVDLLSAGQMIADAFNTEFWYDVANNRICLTKAGTGTTPVALTVGRLSGSTAVPGNVRPAQVSGQGDYFNVFYALGSSRNMMQNPYTPDATKTLCTNRLTLGTTAVPEVGYEGLGYLDKRASQSEPMLKKVLVFDDIYPRSPLVINPDSGTPTQNDPGVVARPRYRRDITTGDRIVIGQEEGEDIYETFALYYIHLPGFQFVNKEYSVSEPTGMLIPGLNVSIHFKTGALAGREFEMRFVNVVSPTPPVEEPDAGDENNDTDNNESTPTNTPSASGTSSLVDERGWVYQGRDADDVAPFYLPAGQWWEIAAISEGNYMIPDLATLVPDEGNEVTVFNVRMPDTYIASAQTELLNALVAEIQRNYIKSDGTHVDHGTYTVEVIPHVVYENGTELSVSLGNAATYNNGFNTTATRVIGITQKVGATFRKTLKLSTEIQKGTISELKDDVTDTERNMDLLTQIGQMNSKITASYERINQWLLTRTKDFGDMWIEDREHMVSGLPSVKLNPEKFAGAWTEGFFTAGGLGTGSGGGGGSTVAWQTSSYADYAKLNVNSVAKDLALYGHTHDDRYYTKNAVDTALSGKASTSSVTAIEDRFDANGKLKAANTQNIEDLTHFSTKVYDASATRNPHYVLAGPASGNSAAAATFRALVKADMPSEVALTDTANTFTEANYFSAVLPRTSGSYNLGSSSYQWGNLYLKQNGNIYFNGLSAFQESYDSGNNAYYFVLGQQTIDTHDLYVKGKNVIVETYNGSAATMTLCLAPTYTDFYVWNSGLSTPAREKVMGYNSYSIEVNKNVIPSGQYYYGQSDSGTKTLGDNSHYFKGVYAEDFYAKSFINWGVGQSFHFYTRGDHDSTHDTWIDSIVLQTTEIGFTIWDSSLSTPASDRIFWMHNGGVYSKKSLFFQNDFAIYGRVSNTDKNVFYFTNSWGLSIGQDTAASHDTTICGRNLYFRAGNNSTNRLYITSSVAHFYIGVESDSYITAGGVNSASDIRLKKKLREVELSVRQIAEAPAVTFEWRKDGKSSAGSIAQYWQGVLPNNVMENSEGMLSMEYGNIALLSAIKVARKVETQEEKIARLEKRVAELEARLNG